MSPQCEQYVYKADWLLSEAFCLYSQRDTYNHYQYHHSTVKEAYMLARRCEVKNLVLWHTEEETNMRTIVIGCDNAAVQLKNELINYMKEIGYTVIDVGCDSMEDTTYYPYIAKRVCEKIAASNYKKEGVLLCGTGLGMAMAANKFPGIRAGVCHDIFSAERLKLSNDGNIICMGSRVIGVELAKRLLLCWLDLEFKDGPSTPKVEAIKELEHEYIDRGKACHITQTY